MSAEELADFRRKRLEAKRIHRAKKYGNGGRHSEKDWQELLKICEYKCVCCGATGKLTRDHIVPLSRGGTDLITNIQPLCKSCNSSKGKHHSMDYRKQELLPVIDRISYKPCDVCKTMFTATNSKRKYCSKKCQFFKHNSTYVKQWKKLRNY